MALLPAVPQQLDTVNAGLALSGAEPLDSYRSRWVGQPEVDASTVDGFALLALVLAITGLYGMVAYAVRQRQRELGIRMALGAIRGDIYRLVLGLGLRLTAVGLLLGGVGLYAVRGWLASQLYGIGALDPATLAAVALLLLAATLLAGWWPARQAARMDPMSCLRIE